MTMYNDHSIWSQARHKATEPTQTQSCNTYDYAQEIVRACGGVYVRVDSGVAVRPDPYDRAKPGTSTLTPAGQY